MITPALPAPYDQADVTLLGQGLTNSAYRLQLQGKSYFWRQGIARPETLFIDRQQERQALLIPHSALLRQGELSAVYLQGKEGWLLTPVLVGAVQEVVDEKAVDDKAPQQVEILSGLSAGDKIAADAWSLVQEVGHE